MSTTIRVSEATRDRFARLAERTGRPMTQLLDDAAESLERTLFFDRLDARYGELREDVAAWTEIDRERTTEAGVLGDATE